MMPSSIAEGIISNPELLQRGEPLAQALRSMRVTGILASNVEIGSEPWSTSIPNPEGCMLLYLVARGHCVGGTLEPRALVDLEEGDALLFPHAGRYLLAQNQTVEPVPLESLLEHQFGAMTSVEAKWKSLFASPFTHHTAQSDSVSVGLHALRMFFDQDVRNALIEGMPPLVHLKGFLSRNRALVEAILIQIGAFGELGLRGQGTAIRLAEALLVCFLSDFLTLHASDRPGFYRGMNDPYLARVIGAIQADPSADWPLNCMAHSAGLSRSAFAERFRIMMDMTPAHFVTAVRMAKATEMLQRTSSPLARIAEMVGYGSEAAFNRAFRKWYGTPPGAVRRASTRVVARVLDAGP